jgi:hypothetical protein
VEITPEHYARVAAYLSTQRGDVSHETLNVINATLNHRRERLQAAGAAKAFRQLALDLVFIAFMHFALIAQALGELS